MTTIIALAPTSAAALHAASQLSVLGVVPAGPSRREALSAADVHSLMLKALKQRQGVSAIASDASSVDPGLEKLWSELVADLMLGNLDHPHWGWGQVLDAHTPAFWSRFDPSTRLVLVYTSPLAELSRRLAQSSVESVNLSEVIQSELDAWCVQQHELLQAYYSLGTHALLVHTDQVQAVIPFLGLGQAALSQSTASSSLRPLPQVLLEQVIRQHPQSQALWAELQAAAQLPAEEAEALPAPTALDMWRALRLQTEEQTRLGAILDQQAKAASEQTVKVQAELQHVKAEAVKANAQLKRQTEQEVQLQAQVKAEAERTAKLQAELNQSRAEAVKANELLKQQAEQEAQLQAQVKAAAERVSQVQAECSRQQTEAAKENELLLAQLHQVQEELEASFHKQQALQAQAVQLQAQVKVSTEQITQSQAQTKAQAEQTVKLQAELTQAKDEVVKANAQIQQQTDQAVQLQAQNKAQAEQTAKLQAELKQARDEVVKANAQIQQQTDQAVQLQAQNKAQADQTAKLQAELKQAKDEMAKANAQIQQQTDQAVQLQAQVKTATEQVVRLTEEVKAAAQLQEGHNRQQANATQENELLLAQLHQVQEALEAAFYKQEATQQKAAQLQEQVKTSAEQVAQLQAQSKAAAEQSAKLQAELKQAKDGTAKANAQLKQQAEQATQWQAQAKTSAEQVAQLQVQSKAATEQSAKLQAELKQAKDDTAKANAQLKQQAEQATQWQAQAKTSAEQVAQLQAQSKAAAEQSAKLQAELKQAKDDTAKANAQLKQQAEESEQLLMQLHQVQEELERYFLQHGQQTAPLRFVADFWRNHAPTELWIDARQPLQGQGWYDAEADGRWTGPETLTTVQLPPLMQGSYVLELHLADAIEPEVVAGLQAKAVWANGDRTPVDLVHEFGAGGGLYPMVSIGMFELPHTTEAWQLQLQLPYNVCLAERGGNDSRRLGIRVQGLRLSLQATEHMEPSA